MSSVNSSLGIGLKFVIFTIGIFWMLEFANNCDTFTTTTGNMMITMSIVLAVVGFNIYNNNKDCL